MKTPRNIGIIISLVALLFSVISFAHLSAQLRTLSEKEYLSEKDLRLAFLSDGIVMRQVHGDFESLSALHEVPHVYRTSGITILVYVYDDIFKRRFRTPKLSAEQYQEVLGVPVSHVFNSAIRNLDIVYLFDDEIKFSVCHQAEKIIDKRLNTVIENTLQKEKDGIRFTIKQQYYCNTLLDKTNHIEMAEYKTLCQLSCQYIESVPMTTQDLTLSISIDGRSTSKIDEWDGQGSIEIDHGNGRCLVKKINDPPVYDIMFSHGDKQFTIQIDQNDILN